MAYTKKTDNPKMGRPAAENPLAFDLKVRIDQETYDSLLAYCEKNGTNKAEVVRMALKEYLLNK